jgi:hypothetical protein
LRLDPILAIIVPSALALALGRAAAIAVSRRSMRSRQAITASDHGKRSWQAIMASKMASLGNALPTTESLA